jgi:tetratricopeptide (TPR) repeat protein
MFSEHEIFTDLRPRYFEGSLGMLYIIEDATTASFQDFDEWLPIIQYSVGNNLEGYVMLLVRNINIEEERNQVENILAEKSQWFNGCLKCNFATGEHVEKIFQEITKLIMENFQRETPFGLRLKAGHYIIKKKFNKAIKCYKRALALSPNYELVKKELVQLERQKKRKSRI